MAEYISFQPRDNYKTHLYVGTGASNAQTFPETTAMQPDLVWIKNRDTTDFGVWTDSERGATKYFKTSTTLGNTTNVESLKSFDSDGFTVGTMNEVNTNTENFVSWNWKMGTTTGIAGSPSITPDSYTLNATAGQSIIQYTGNATAAATIPHGLPATPSFVMIKNETGESWKGYHIAGGNDKGAELDGIYYTGCSTCFNDTTPTSTLVTLGDSAYTNQTGVSHVAYCFTPIKGYSAFQGYTGNGNVDGAFVYTGFRPSFLSIKKIASGGDWMLFDDKRIGYNEDNDTQNPNLNEADGTTDYLDLLSNGFKIRTSDALVNSNATDYAYIAFAEFPLVSSNDVPGVAR